MQTVTGMGVLVVIAAGNASGPVELPGNCATVVPGVMAVAGLRNVGTKVGYSSFGAQVSVSAPAGNCINTTGDCLRSMDSTTNTGTTTPVSTVDGGATYTNETNPNLRYELRDARGVGHRRAHAVGERQPDAGAACGAHRGERDTVSTELAGRDAPTTDLLLDKSQCRRMYLSQHGYATMRHRHGECLRRGAGGVGAHRGRGHHGRQFVECERQRRFLRAHHSLVFLGRQRRRHCDPVQRKRPPWRGAGTVTLTVKDSEGATDNATITVTSGSASSSAPTSAGTSASACPTALKVTPVAPTIAQASRRPAVGPTIASTLTFTLSNANGYALTQSQLQRLAARRAHDRRACAGHHLHRRQCRRERHIEYGDLERCEYSGERQLHRDRERVEQLPPAAYTNTIAANALMTGPAGGNAAAAPSSTLTVTAPNPPTVAEAFSPSSVGQNASATLTITLSNSNAYPLTAVGLTHALASGLTAKSSPAALNTCGGTLPAPSSSVTLSGASIPASSSCTVALTVSSGTAGSYKDTIAAGAVTTALAGSNTTPATATLTVNASGGGGGGGALDWLDVMFVAGVLLVGRGQAARRRPGNRD